MNWRQNTDIMHLSFNFAQQTFCGTYSTYVLLKTDSACKNVHNLVHDVVHQKDMFLQGTYLFRSFVILRQCVCHSFFGRSGHRPPSSEHVPRGTCSCICTWFVRTWNFTIACAIARTIFLIGPGFEPLTLYVIDFYGSRVWIPARAARSFRGSRVRFPGPDRPF